MKRYLYISFGLFLFACGDHVQKEQIRVKVVQKKCTNGYFLSLKHELKSRDEKKTDTYELTVLKDKKKNKLSLQPTPSGSGSKYKTADGKYIFWEHQDEFRFGTEDSTYCLCR